MTMVEKAKELVNKYDETLTYLESKSKAKECALIAVDEILYFMDMFNLDLEMKHQHKWWQQVRKEIENL